MQLGDIKSPIASRDNVGVKFSSNRKGVHETNVAKYHPDTKAGTYLVETDVVRKLDNEYSDEIAIQTSSSDSSITGAVRRSSIVTPESRRSGIEGANWRRRGVTFAVQTPDESDPFVINSGNKLPKIRMMCN